MFRPPIAAFVCIIVGVAFGGCAAYREKREASEVRVLAKQFTRLAGTYCEGGEFRSIGGGDHLRLNADGTFIASHEGCIGKPEMALGWWHPGERKIAFEIIRHDGPHNVCRSWLLAGVGFVERNGTIYLYRLDEQNDEASRRRNATWPLCKSKSRAGRD